MGRNTNACSNDVRCRRFTPLNLRKKLLEVLVVGDTKNMKKFKVISFDLIVGDQFGKIFMHLGIPKECFWGVSVLVEKHI